MNKRAKSEAGKTANKPHAASEAEASRRNSVTLGQAKGREATGRVQRSQAVAIEVRVATGAESRDPCDGAQRLVITR